MDEFRQQMAAAHAPVELAVARANHAKTMCLLRALKAGQVLDPSQVPVVLPTD